MNWDTPSGGQAGTTFWSCAPTAWPQEKKAWLNVCGVTSPGG